MTNRYIMVKVKMGPHKGKGGPVQRVEGQQVTLYSIATKEAITIARNRLETIGLYQFKIPR